MIPTWAPASASAKARFTATVDLPTPPLPDDTAIVCLTSGVKSAYCARPPAGAWPCGWLCAPGGDRRAREPPPVVAWNLEPAGTCPTGRDAVLGMVPFGPLG